MASTTVFALLLGLAGCGDDKAADSGSETGTAGETATDTVADEVGESGTATTTSTTDTTTTDATTTTDDGSCPIGADGCPCTPGGGCDPGLMCAGGTCAPAADTSTSDTGTTDTGTTDTGTTDTGTTDTGVDPLAYQACPNGDADCLPNEVCITGTANQGQLPWTMCTSGECNGDADCVVDDNDFCNDLPGDGQPIDYCVPLICDMQNPCPDPMQCAQGFGGGGAISVCVWPN